METASRTARPVTIRLVLVTTPPVWHCRMPRFTPVDAPKSSALMISHLFTFFPLGARKWAPPRPPPLKGRGQRSSGGPLPVEALPQGGEPVQQAVHLRLVA